MKKFPKPWYRPSRQLWFVTIDGKQYKLGSDKEQAFAKYAELLNKPKPQRITSDTLIAVVDSFLEWVQRQRAPDTYEWYRYRLERFVRRFPQLRAADVRPFHVQEWVDSYPLSVTSRRNYMRSVKRCLSWAVRQGYLEKNPVLALEIPAGEHREISLTPAEINSLLANIRDPAFRDLVVVTMETGCRPQESLRVEARHVDLMNQRWVFSKSESKNKKISRIVYLTDKAVEIVRRLLAQHPTGKLFRSSRGKPWTTSAVNNAFRSVRKRIGKQVLQARQQTIPADEINRLIPSLQTHCLVKGKSVAKTQSELKQEAKRKLLHKQATALAPKWSLYALRHTWATHALQRGVDPLTVAILMGHSDPSMLSKVYQHLSLNPVHMLDQAKKAVEGKT